MIEKRFYRSPSFKRRVAVGCLSPILTATTLSACGGSDAIEGREPARCQTTDETVWKPLPDEISPAYIGHIFDVSSYEAQAKAEFGKVVCEPGIDIGVDEPRQIFQVKGQNGECIVLTIRTDSETEPPRPGIAYRNIGMVCLDKTMNA